MSIALLGKIAAMFLMMLAGWIIVKARLLKPEDSQVLSVLLLYLIIPCSIISAFQIQSGPEVRSGLILGFIAAAIVHAALILIVSLLRRPLRLDAVEQTSIIYSNSGNLLIPIVSALLGPEWVVYVCAYNCVQLVLYWSHCKSVISGDVHIDIKKMLTNVNMISVLLGFFIFIFQLELPSVLQSAIDSMAGTIGPASMIVIGMLIAGMDLKRVFTMGRVWLISFLRLVAVPLASIVLLRYMAAHSSLEQADTVLMISLLACAAPAGTTITQMAQVYGADKEYACAINVVTTLLCIVTMPIMIAIYQL